MSHVYRANITLAQCQNIATITITLFGISQSLVAFCVVCI